MDALVAIFSILFTFWPLLVFFGFRDFTNKEISFTDGLRLGIRRIFVAWAIWAVLLAIIYVNGRRPVSLFPEKLNTLSFVLMGVVTGAITLIWESARISRRRIRLADAEKLEDLLAMDPDHFERLVAQIFRAYGYRAQVSGGNFDHGVDVVVFDHEEKWVVQCKRYRGSVGEPIIRDLFGTMLHERAKRAYLMTTGTFTRQARDWARGKPIVLYDGQGLVKLIQRTQLNRSKYKHAKRRSRG